MKKHIETDYIVFSERLQNNYKTFISKLDDEELYALQQMIEEERFNRSIYKFGDSGKRKNSKDPGGEDCDWRYVTERERDCESTREFSRFLF
jgi:hypothetical protein